MTSKLLDAPDRLRASAARTVARTIAKWCGAAEATPSVGEAASELREAMIHIFYAGRLDALKEEDSKRFKP